MRLAHFGTFDVENYGDLLFPLLIQAALPDAEIVNVSPIGGAPPFTDSPATITFEMASRERFDGVVIGGGNIIHGGSRVIADYRRVRYVAYPSLWAGAAAVADRQRVPLVVNASGVSSLGAFQFLTRRALNLAAYLAVRDDASRNVLLDAGVTKRIQVVPDTALLLAELWDKADLEADYTSLVESGSPTVVFHVNSRYMATVSETAKHLDRISARLSARPILVAIGRCHGDHHVVAEVSKEMTCRPITLERPESLRQVAALIAHSVAYIGSSMHGLITACSYSRPALVVAGSSAMAKFAGFLSHVQGVDRLLPTWTSVTGEEEGLTRPADAGTAKALVSDHWSEIRRALDGPPASGQGGPLLHNWRPLVEGGGRLVNLSASAKLRAVSAVKPARRLLKGLR